MDGTRAPGDPILWALQDLVHERTKRASGKTRSARTVAGAEKAPCRKGTGNTPAKEHTASGQCRDRSEAQGYPMETLIVDAEGKITIPSAVLQKRGLQPGDAAALVESAEGLLVYQGGIDPKTLAWWQTLSDEERHLAEAEARRYEALSDAERDAL